MSKMKVLVAGSALGAAILAAPSFAATTGTVGITSEYTFRGIDSEDGAAVQGSLDWADGSGLYAGLWASNSNIFPAAGNELDLYGGYKFKLAEGMELDVGAIYYLFSESDETENSVCGDDPDGPLGPLAPPIASCDSSYAEIYAGLNIGGFSGKVYYADKFFGDFSDDVTTAGIDGEDSTYVNLAYTHTIKDGLTLKGAIGSQSGDGADNLFGDSVTDYALTLTKSLENGFSASFGVVGTDLELTFTDPVTSETTTVFEDGPKFVVTLAKGFEI